MIGALEGRRAWTQFLQIRHASSQGGGDVKKGVHGDWDLHLPWGENVEADVEK